jgi:cysteine synthase A
MYGLFTFIGATEEKMIYRNISELVGGTPLLSPEALKSDLDLEADIYCKLEYKNPAGSAKDRVALSMILEAEARGLLRDGSVIIEPTSGNTGIGLAAICASRPYRLILTMPESMSVERRKLLSMYGAEIVLTDAAKGMQGAIDKALEIAEKTEGSFIPSQFENPANPTAHRSSTGPEIWHDTNGKVDIFVAGVGTGGTLTGVGEYLKEQDPNIKIVAVEPASSPLLSEGRSGAHGLQGIGANFVPKVLNKDIIDEIITVSEEQAYEAGRMLARTEGVLVGISSGAALHAAIELAKRPENHGKKIVCLLPDTGDRYISTEYFE